MTDVMIAADNSLAPGEEVDLYTIDLNPIGFNTVIRFTPSRPDGGSLWFGGKEYLSRPINITGFGRSADDAPPEPVLRVSNIDKLGNSLLMQYNDLLGAKVTRIVTYSMFLDKLPDGSNNPAADPTAMKLPEIWFIEQKTNNTPLIVSWRLKSALDLNGKRIPARLVLKDVCTRAYRVWDASTSTWVYPTKRACPYAGSAMFTRNNASTADPTQDVCPKNFEGCAKRFPGEALPGWFFPGVRRLPQ